MVGCDKIELTDLFDEKIRNEDEVAIINGWSKNFNVVKILHVNKPGTSQEMIVCKDVKRKNTVYYNPEQIRLSIKLNEGNRWQFSK